MINFGCGVYLMNLFPSRKYMEWRNDPKIWRWTRQNDLLSPSDHAKWLEKIQSDPTIKMYAIMRDAQSLSISDDLESIGVCGLTSIDLQNRHAEFSLYIAPMHQKQGYAKPSLKTLLYHGFQNMGLKSIWGETFENNPAQRLFREIGMQEDGKRRQFYFKDGKYWDAILFSILSDEFLNKHGVKSCFG